MGSVQPLPGSFRDPSGNVYQFEGRIFRAVNDCFSQDFDFVTSTGLFQKLAIEGLLLPFEVVSSDVLGLSEPKPRYVLEAPRLPFISYPYEWSFPSLKAAALLHLRIHLQSLEVGVTLSDASAYNIQFQGNQPVFIDHLSFRRYLSGEMWVGHRQFCEQFLNPLLLRAFFGISHNAWYRGTQEGIPTGEIRKLLKWRHCLNWNVLTHVVLQDFFQKTSTKNTKSLQEHSLGKASFPLSSFKAILEKMFHWISQLTPLKEGESTWGDYDKTCSYSSTEIKSKKQFILEFVQTVQPALIWDFGCNTGEYSEAALNGGARNVVGFDFDQGALDGSYRRAVERRLSFQALFMDAANPSPSQGWNGRERESLQSRASADAILALALVHHLAIARNIPLVQVVNWLITLAPQGVIEFVPKNDPMVQELLSLRQDIFPEYTAEHFMALLKEKAVIIKNEIVSKSGRVLVWFKRM
ncbi:MAG: class I SAM-dependent methyltransferase [Nitrospirales bacterium]|nr:class I SAM-dependent methyltransferase [Nitrospirales bacterium]MDR4483460.1 class I SAM-dependent methyltransferase [Nitrospirales bacterium]